jgi:hypothetical protein
MSDTKEKAGELLKGAITAEVDAVKSAASKMTTKKSAATTVAE